MASLTKLITGTAAMCWIGDGLVELNRPVHSYVPEFEAEGEGKDAVMVHHAVTLASDLATTGTDAHAGQRRDRPIPVSETNQGAIVHE